MEKIKYLGQIKDKDGRRPDTERASAIKNNPVPENVFSIQCFLGLANNYNVFVPNIHIHSLQAPFNELIKNEKDRVWTTECQEAFEKIKEVLTSDLFIAHYNLDTKSLWSVMLVRTVLEPAYCTKWKMDH